MVGLEPFLFLVLRKKVSESGVWCGGCWGGCLVLLVFKTQRERFFVAE